MRPWETQRSGIEHPSSDELQGGVKAATHFPSEIPLAARWHLDQRNSVTIQEFSLIMTSVVGGTIIDDHPLQSRTVCFNTDWIVNSIKLRCTPV